MEKNFNIEERPEGFVYVETTTFPVEAFGNCLKRNIQVVELIFTVKEDLEAFLIAEREKKENAKSLLTYNLTKTDDELKKLDVLTYSNNIIKRLKRKN